MYPLAARAAFLFVFVFVPGVAVADCWRLQNGQVVSTSAGSAAPVKGAQQIVCPAQQQAQQQAAQQKQQQQAQQYAAQQKQQRLAQQQAAQQKQQQQAQQQAAQQKQQQLAQQQAAQQKPQLVFPQPTGLPPMNGLTTAGSTPQTASQSKKEPLFTTCGNGSVLRVILQVYEFGQSVTNLVSFNAACSAHDSCYGERGSRRTKGDCDDEFARIATQICNGAVVSKSACLDQKNLFYGAIRKYGGDPFCKARGIDCRMAKYDPVGSTLSQGK